MEEAYIDICEKHGIENVNKCNTCCDPACEECYVEEIQRILEQEDTETVARWLYKNINACSWSSKWLFIDSEEFYKDYGLYTLEEVRGVKLNQEFYDKHLKNKMERLSQLEKRWKGEE
tara:strand:+ start:352 stop:705 length:354 start_codon:yes stop_codon:yes gene_type:complete